MAAAVDSPLSSSTFPAGHGLPQAPARAQPASKSSLRAGSRASRASSRGCPTVHFLTPANQASPSSGSQAQGQAQAQVQVQTEAEAEVATQQHTPTQTQTHPAPASHDAPASPHTAKEEAEAPRPPCPSRPARLLSDDFDPTHGAKPFSPFYIHPMTETSKMQLHNEREALRGGTRSSESGNGGDLESGGARSHGKDSTSTRASCDAERWGLIHKRARAHGWLDGLAPRTRFLVKLALASFVICVMFGVGIVLTLAVSGRPWPRTGPAKTD
ncbi:hypothetical protein KEM52_006007 [Ascosphaera acerosa]|nr:hypothetical protein KEM52_006007 [Ascosphaera acerosa]